MIVVTGATGNIGRPLTKALAEAGEQVVAVSRHAAEVPDGVRHQVADLSDPESLDLTGAKALFLLLSGDLHAVGASPAALVERAVAQGVGRVVLLSSLGVRTRPFGTTRVELRGLEDLVRGSGLGWAVLRPGGFASNALWWAESVRTRRTVAAPFGDTGVPVIDPADIAEVAATALLSDRNGILELTGPEVVTPRQQAQAIADALGEPVRFHELTRAEAKAGMEQLMPGELADDTLDILGSPTPDEVAVSPDVEKVLGRAPRTFADWVERNVEAFR
ncbi:SDR family oxidoreductase [Lentzea sp. NPDC060358]|uniref:SDR family oxidoreductase n=1 Tax=Lentzea sp. NPDC060358 TaxID=3347103 RepID=UPI00366024D4